MSQVTGALSAIGNTPLIKLKGPSEATGCDIYAKAEYANPGGSVKDRPALSIIEAAEAEGRLEPGGLVVEGTAGNTGIGVTIVANAKGYRSLIVMPDNQSEEKYQTLKALGAELKLVPPAPYRSDGNFQHVARRMAENLASTEQHGVIWANQFDNTANRDAHYRTTASEIFNQTDGQIDGFICAAGSGGTIAGVAMGLKERSPAIVTGLADPMGASLFNYYKTGALKAEGSSIAEGIGQSRITANLEGAPIDEAFQIPDCEAVPLAFQLLRDEGLCVGVSTGINVAGAMALARQMGPGKTIVTILCDSGFRYLSRLFNPEFLRSKSLDVPTWLDK